MDRALSVSGISGIDERTGGVDNGRPAEIEHLPGAQRVAGRLKDFTPATKHGALVISDIAGRSLGAGAAQRGVRKRRVALLDEKNFQIVL